MIEIATKWPRLLVAGRDVTPEQANEILVRTDDWVMSSNDKPYVRAVLNLIGVPCDVHGWPDYRAMCAFEQHVRALQLSYCYNARIVSSWIGGPHGWCDWNGRIGCSTWNIGKWPSIGEVTEDWVLIAEAFPYLDLRVQVIEDEGAGSVAGEWIVKDGAATLAPGPWKQLRDLAEVPPEEIASAMMFRADYSGRERGVTLDRLRQAIAQVEGSR